MHRSKLSCLQLLYERFSLFYKDFDHIFLTCSEKFINISKLWKIFRCATSFYQYFFVSDKSCYHKTNSGIPTGMRCLWDVSIRSPLRETSQRPLGNTSKETFFCDVFKTSQIHLKKDIFFVASLRRLKYISEKISFLRPL